MSSESNTSDEAAGVVATLDVTDWFEEVPYSRFGYIHVTLVKHANRILLLAVVLALLAAQVVYPVSDAGWHPIVALVVVFGLTFPAFLPASIITIIVLVIRALQRPRLELGYRAVPEASAEPLAPTQGDLRGTLAPRPFVFAQHYSMDRIGQAARYLGISFVTLVLLAASAWAMTLGDSFAFGLVEDGVDTKFEIVVAVVVLVLLAGALHNYGSIAHNLLRASATEVVARDSRAPVCLLRSFTDDDLGVFRRVEFGHGGKLPMGRVTWQRLAVEIEPVLAGEAERLGPLIAIGEPGETLPDFGAYRAYFADDEWRDAIDTWTGRASLIIVIAGTTPMVGWEIGMLAASGRLDRAMVIVPPLGRENREARWAVVRQALADSPWAPSMDTEMPPHVVALCFRPEGGVLRIDSKRRHAVDYLSALRVALTLDRDSAGPSS